MNKEKTMLRRWYFDEWQADEAEAWLEDLAEQGWLLESIGTRFTRFRKAEPSVLRFLCIPRHVLRSYETEESVAELSAASGWMFIGEHSKMQVFCAPAGTKPPQRPKEAREAEAEKKKAIRHYRSQIFLYVGFLAGMFLLFYFMMNSSVLADYLLHKELKLFVYLLCLLSLIVTAVFFVPPFVSKIRKLREDCMEQVDADTLQSRYRKTISLNRTIWIMGILVVLLPFVSDLLPLLPRGSDNLAGHMAIVSVSDIVGAGARDSSGGNIVDSKQSLLFPTQLDAYDSFHLKDPITGEYLYDRGGALVEKAYHARAPWLAALLAELLARHGESGSFVFMTPTPVPPFRDTLGFDMLWGYTSPYRASASLIALKGCDVYFLQYDGDITVEALASALNRKIEQAKGS